jgi:hypothetical protein
MRCRDASPALGVAKAPGGLATRATLEFHHSRTPQRQAELNSGTTLEKEKEVLAAWKASNG